MTGIESASADGDGHELRLPGGNVGGAVRVGATVRRQRGIWTPAVHALLEYLDGRIAGIPRVLGQDEQGREVLSYLPGHVVHVDTELLTDGQLVSLLAWTREFHEVVAGFSHAGPWRFFPVSEPTLICHNDIAPYNACFAGDDCTEPTAADVHPPSTTMIAIARPLAIRV